MKDHGHTTVRKFGSFFLCAALAWGAVACDSKEEANKEAEGAAAESAETKPRLRLRHDSKTCRDALECCVEMVKLQNDGKDDQKQVNLSCSGVGMAGHDARCEEFRKGYVHAWKDKGDPPAVCGAAKE